MTSPRLRSLPLAQQAPSSARATTRERAISPVVSDISEYPPSEKSSSELKKLNHGTKRLQDDKYSEQIKAEEPVDTSFGLSPQKPAAVPTARPGKYKSESISTTVKSTSANKKAKEVITEEHSLKDVSVSSTSVVVLNKSKPVEQEKSERKQTPFTSPTSKKKTRPTKTNPAKPQRYLLISIIYTSL